jgi:putative oxidoreductase
MNIGLWIAQGILLVMYAMAGYMKGITPEKTQEQMAWARERSTNAVRFIGISELLGALGMILPMLSGILPWLTPLAALGLVVVQVLAIVTVHLPRKEYKALPMNIVLLALALFVAIGRWGLLVA